MALKQSTGSAGFDAVAAAGEGRSLLTRVTPEEQEKLQMDRILQEFEQGRFFQGSPVGRPSREISQTWEFVEKGGSDSDLSGSSAQAHNPLFALCKQLFFFNHKANALLEALKTTPYFQEMRSHAGLRFFKHRNFPILLCISYATALSMLLLNREISRSFNEKSAKSLIDLVTIIFAGFIGKSLYGGVTNYFHERSLVKRYAQQFHLLKAHKILWQEYFLAHDMTNFYFIRTLKRVREAPEKINLQIKTRAQLDMALIERGGNYQKWLMVILSYLTQQFVTQSSFLPGMMPIPYLCILALLLTLPLMIILKDPRWLRSGVHCVSDGISRIAAALLRCVSCCMSRGTSIDTVEVSTIGMDRRGIYYAQKQKDSVNMESDLRELPSFHASGPFSVGVDRQSGALFYLEDVQFVVGATRYRS